MGNFMWHYLVQDIKKDINVISPIRIKDAIISDRIQKFMSDSVRNK